MIKILVMLIFTSIVLSGCAKKTKKIQNDGLDLSYKVRQGSDFASECKSDSDNDFCKCYAKETEKFASGERQVKSLVRINPVSQAIANKILSKREVIKGCDRYIPADLKFYIPVNSKTARNILNENKGKILTPNNLIFDSVIDKPIGWSFSKRGPKYGEVNPKALFTLIKSEGNKHYFEYQGVIKKSEYLLTEGKLMHKSKSGEFKGSAKDGCDFVVGDCFYTNYDGQVKKIYTEFRDGVWVRNVPYHHHRVIERDIYDKNGLTLYHSYEAPSRGVKYEERRLEVFPAK